MSAAKSWRKKKTASPALTPFLRIVIILLGVGVLATASGFAVAATQESHDDFCASCHTQPESTYYQRAQAGQPVDLASAHTAQQTRCIDCHSGQGVVGRVQAELLGARNALLFYTHTATQPAKATVPVGDENCLKCHENVMAGRGRDNHFHEFLPRWQAADSNAGRCTSCHGGHTTDGTAQLRYLNEATTTAQCDACHRTLGAGE